MTHVVATSSQCLQQLGQYASSPDHRGYCYAELASAKQQKVRPVIFPENGMVRYSRVMLTHYKLLGDALPSQLLDWCKTPH